MDSVCVSWKILVFFLIFNEIVPTFIMGRSPIGGPNGSPSTSSSSNIGHFWVISDMHHDFTYGINKLPASCRSIIPHSQLSQFGNYECDAPWITLNQTIFSMKHFAADIDFILWMGDSVMHTREDEGLILNQTVNIKTIQDLSNLIKEAFPNVPLIPTIGNHDFFRNAQTSKTMYEALAKIWFHGSDPAIKTFQTGGYFSVDISPRLRLLNLNTILYYKSNKQVNPAWSPDPEQQFQWLQTQLQKSKLENKKVFITGHVPPGPVPKGETWFYSEYNQQFIDLVKDFADVINAMFFGHNHETSFKIITSNAKGSIPVFIAPSVTPWTYKYNHNPAVWLVTYDRQYVIPVKIDQYYADLLEANRLQTLNYTIGYSIPNEYKMENLSGESFLDFRERMKIDDELFQKYMKNMFANVTTSKQPEINLDLKINILCAMNSNNKKSFGTCKAHGFKPVNNTLKLSATNIFWLISLFLTNLSIDFSSVF